MQYDPQVSLFLKNVPDPVPTGTTTQKLVALLKSDVQAHSDNAMMALASATAQGNNAELARDEGLIPVFLDLLQTNPRRQKDASFAIMIICTKEKNADVLAESGKWTVVLEVLEKLPFPLPDPEVPKNLISALHYLSLNAKIRPLLGQANHLKVLFEYAGKRSNPVFVEKLFPVLLNLCNSDTTKESIRVVGGIPTLISVLSSPTPALRDSALKIIWQITKIDKNRQELRKEGVLKPLLAIMSLPLPASQDIIVIALRVLGNLAMDDDFTVNYITNNNMFGPLVKLVDSKNPSVIEQSAVCMQYLANESSISSMAQAGAYDVIVKACKESNAFLPRLSLIYSFLLIDGEIQARFVETGGPEFLLSFFDYNNAELNKHACRGIANVTGLYDDIKAALGTEPCLKHLLRLSQSDDKQTVEYAVNALINLARYEPIGLLLNKIGGVQFIAQLVEAKDKATMIKASMVLTNLSRFSSLNAMLTSMGWIEKAVALATNPDPEVQVQGAKLLINFALSGRNRKYVHDKGLLEKVKNTKNTSSNANAKSQLEIAINNLSFPYEERYEGLDFKLEEKMPAAGEYNYDEDSDDESAIYAKLIEENKKKLENERRRIERERKEAEDQLKKRQELILKKRKEEEAQQQKKKAEEEKQRSLKRNLEVDLLKKHQEEEKRKIAEKEVIAKKAVEDRKRIEAEEEKRRAEEEERKKKRLEEKQRKVTEGKTVLTPAELAAKAQRKEERRLRNEDRQKRREIKAKRKIEKAQHREMRENNKVEKAMRQTMVESEERKRKEREEDEARVKAEKEERTRSERETAAEETKIKQEHEEREKKRRAELEALEAEVKKKEEEAEKQAEKEAGEGKVKDQTAAKAEKRVKITQEILNVEKGYVGNLSIAIRKFLNPLTISASQKKPILTVEKVKSIFSIIEIIYNYNSLLLEGLETRTKRWIADERTSPLCFGDIFVKMTDYMTCYSTYINNYNNSMETLLDSKKNNPEFAQFLRKVESDPECRMQELSSFIINPIQQLPRYIMLLADLLRNTAPEHPDYANIGIAAEKMKKLTEHVNEQKRESETMAAIMNVQHRLRGKVPQLLIPFRKLVKEGPISLGDINGVKDKDGYVFLFNDLLVLARLKKDQALKYKEHASLQGLTVEDLKDEQVKNVKNAFMLKGSLPTLLSAKTLSDKTVWLQKFNAAIAGKA